MVTVAEVAKAIGAEAVGDISLDVERPARPRDARDGDLALAMDPAFADELRACPARAAVLGADADWRALGLDAAIIVTRQRYALAGITAQFDAGYAVAAGIHPSAVIDPTAEIGANCAIGPFVHIGAGVRIGENARIHSHVSIAEGASLGPDAVVMQGVRIGARCTIGARVILQPNVVIGGDGFSFVTPEPSAVEEMKQTGKHTSASRAAEWTRIASIGAVTLGDDVEIGANSTIDRGTVADTRVGDGTKIDNLVTLGHNVEVGRLCLLCGQVGIAGSAVIGDRVILGGQVGVADHVEIGDDVIAGAQAGISGRVKAGTMVMGYPAQPRDRFISSLKSVRRVPQLLKRVEALEKRVPKRDATD